MVKSPVQPGRKDGEREGNRLISKEMEEACFKKYYMPTSKSGSHVQCPPRKLMSLVMIVSNILSCLILPDYERPMGVRA